MIITKEYYKISYNLFEKVMSESVCLAKLG